MATELTSAFEAGANATTSEISYFILGIFFGCLFIISAYILIQEFKEIKNGKPTLSFLILVIKLFLMISILMYFLLQP